MIRALPYHPRKDLSRMADLRPNKPGVRKLRPALDVRHWRWTLGVLTIVALAAMARPASAFYPPTPKSKNIVYVESNDPSGNAILAYSRDDLGNLTALPGSPFPTGGLGVTPTFAL